MYLNLLSPRVDSSYINPPRDRSSYITLILNFKAFLIRSSHIFITLFLFVTKLLLYLPMKHTDLT